MMLNSVATMGCDALNFECMETLGEKVKRLRGKKPVEKIARASGITRDAIWRLESGKTASPRWDTIEGLARAFDMTPDELLDGTEGNDRVIAPAHDHILLEDDDGTRVLMPADSAGKAFALAYKVSGKSLRDFMASLLKVDAPRELAPEGIEPVDFSQTAKINDVNVEPNGEKKRKPKAG